MSRFKLMNMIIREAAVEILEYAKDSKPKHFNEFRQLINPRTKRKFSPKTIVDRTKELVKLCALKRVITKTKNGREVIGYQITAKGLKALEMSIKFEQKLKTILF